MTKIPIACLLDTSTRADRFAAWRTLISTAGKARQAVPGGVEVRFAHGAAAELKGLVAGERECCAWADWQLTVNADGVVLRATSSSEPGPAVLQELFGL